MSGLEAVLFDFAGTLFVPQPAVQWVAAAARDLALELAESEVSSLAEQYLAAGLPGAPYPAAVPDDLAEAYAGRDLSAEAHEAAYVGLLSTVVAPRPDLARAIYRRILDPACWIPYSDTRRTIAALSEAGIPAGVVSNAGFDLKPILRHHGLGALADRCTLSYEVGVVKPDPRIFEAALRKLGSAPERTLMVGDHEEADGGAAAAGLRTLILPMTPPGTEHGLDRVLDLTSTGGVWVE